MNQSEAVRTSEWLRLHVVTKNRGCILLPNLVSPHKSTLNALDQRNEPGSPTLFFLCCNLRFLHVRLQIENYCRATWMLQAIGGRRRQCTEVTMWSDSGRSSEAWPGTGASAGYRTSCSTCQELSYQICLKSILCTPYVLIL